MSKPRVLIMAFSGKRYGKQLEQFNLLLAKQMAGHRIEVHPSQEYEELEARCERYREALAWYADPEHWTIPYVEGHLGDYGDRARQALAEGGEGDE